MILGNCYTFLTMETITELNALKSPANGTDDREARSFRWYAARTQMNCERKVEHRFQQIALETYLPIQEEIHQWSDRKKKVLRMVIPMVLFVKINSKEALKVHSKRDNQFYGFITKDRAGHYPAEIPDTDIDRLKYILGAADHPVFFEQQNISAGDKVQIVRGSLKGIEGVTQSLKSGKAFILVNMGLLGYVKTEINLHDCKKCEY